MNCARLTQVLDAWIDGELDSTTTADIQAHVDACTACAALEGQRRTLSAAIREDAPRYAAPPGLRLRVSRAIRREDGRSAPTWAQAGAIAACAALLSALLTFWLLQPETEARLNEQVVSAHVASLGQPSRLVSVDSAERHTVKPWFQGKVAFAPAVKEGSEGFVLLGGRIDRVGTRESAAIVYRIRKLVVNVFVWPAHGANETEGETRVRGFSIVNWNEDGLHYAAVSDVDPRDLRRFAEHMRGR